MTPGPAGVYAHLPWAVILDNHDAVWDGDPAEPPRNTLARRTAASQAWWEHMPLPRRAAPQGPSMPIHRRVEVGDLLILHLLDRCQFRDDEDVCGAPPPNIGPQCDAVLAATCSMLASAQETWLDEGLRTSRARWDAIAQTVLMASIDLRGVGDIGDVPERPSGRPLGERTGLLGRATGRGHGVPVRQPLLDHRLSDAAGRQEQTCTPHALRRLRPSRLAPGIR